MTTLKEALETAYRLELEDIPSEMELRADEGLTFTPAFERSMRKLICRTDHPARRQIMRAAACLLLAVLIGGGCVLALVPEVRAEFVGWVYEVYESWFVYRYHGKGEPASGNTVYVPAWLPEGYEEVEAPQPGSFVRAQYERDGEQLTLAYLKGRETSWLDVEWDRAEVCRTKVGRMDADLYRNPGDGPSILVWTDTERDIVFWLTASLPEEELLRVAGSVRESGPVPRRYTVNVLPTQYGGYGLASVTEEEGWGETVYDNTGGFFVTFGYSHGGARIPRPEQEGVEPAPVPINGLEGWLYPASEEGGDKTLLWTEQNGDVLWLKAPLPDEELVWVAENVLVKLNHYMDLMELPVSDPEAPLLEQVELALSDGFIAQVEEQARRDAQTNSRMSKEFDALWRARQDQYISPPREDSMARVAAETERLYKEQRYGETILVLFDPFYTAVINVGCYSTVAHICDEHGAMIATYNSRVGEWAVQNTLAEQQFSYEARQIYLRAFEEARAELAGNQ